MENGKTFLYGRKAEHTKGQVRIDPGKGENSGKRLLQSSK